MGTPGLGNGIQPLRSHGDFVDDSTGNLPFSTEVQKQTKSGLKEEQSSTAVRALLTHPSNHKFSCQRLQTVAATNTPSSTGSAGAGGPSRQVTRTALWTDLLQWNIISGHTQSLPLLGGSVNRSELQLLSVKKPARPQASFLIVPVARWKLLFYLV